MVMPAWIRDYRELAWQVGESLITRSLLFGMGMVISIVTVRLLGTTGRGLIAVAATIGLLGAQFGHLGLHAAHTYYLAQDRRLLPSVFGNSLLVAAVCGGGTALLAGIVFTCVP